MVPPFAVITGYIRRIPLIGLRMTALLLVGGAIPLLFSGCAGCSARGGGPPRCQQECVPNNSSMGELLPDGMQAPNTRACFECYGGSEGAYGIMLLDVQDIARSVDSIVGLVRSTAGAAPATTAVQSAACSGIVESRCGNQTDLSGLISNFLSAIQSDLWEISVEAAAIEANPVTFEVPEFTISIPSLADPNTGKGALYITLGESWDIKEARILGGASKVILALVNMVEAHKFSLDLNVIGGESNPNGQEPVFDLNDIVGTLRSLGILFWSSPDLLTLEPDAAGGLGPALQRYEAVPIEIGDAWGELARLFIDANNNPPGDLAINMGKPVGSTTNRDTYLSGSVMSWLDKNGNNELDGGDGIHIGCWDNIAGAPCFKDPVVVPSGVKPAAISQGVQLLNAVKCSLDPTCTGEKVIPLDEANGVLSVLSQNPVPGVVSINPGAFFTNPKPLRNYLPIWLNDSCGNVYLMAEGEVPQNTEASVLAKTSASAVPTTTGADVVHFPLPGTSFPPTTAVNFYYGGCRDLMNSNPTTLLSLEFEPDGIFPDASTQPQDLTTTRNDTIVYLWFQDPSFNGAIQVCPNLLDAVAGVAAQVDYSAFAADSCAAGNSDWVTPTPDAAGNQLFGKALAWLIRDGTRRNILGSGNLPTAP